MLIIFIICFANVNCVIYNVFYCLYIECKINLSIYQSNSNESLLYRQCPKYMPVLDVVNSSVKRLRLKRFL